MPNQTPDNFVDVLVIGAGPAGLMCSNALAAAGDIKLRVIDQRCVQPDQVFGLSDTNKSRPSKVALGQADGIQPRTIEVLQVSPNMIHQYYIVVQDISELWPS